MEVKVTKLEEECKQENAKLEAEMSDLQDIHNNLEEQNKKLENKYKTLSKANSAAIADIENLKAENKNLRSELHDASTSKASELMQLRDSMARLSAGR
jgi:molecular chaperone GrpE (heat shock protein)